MNSPMTSVERRGPSQLPEEDGLPPLLPTPVLELRQGCQCAGRRLELWVLTTAAPTFKSESWLCLGGGFWVSCLAGWGVWKSGFLFSFLFVFLLVGLVLLCLLLRSSGSLFVLSMTAITDP